MRTKIFLLCFALASANVIDKSRTKLEANAKGEKKEKCMQDLGCFRIDEDFFHPIHRPFNLLPYDREFINVKYRIYTTKSTSKYHLLPATNVRKFDFSKVDINPEHDTKIITHGWIDNQLFGEWMKKMKNEFYKNGNYNVVIVDWSGGNAPPYTQAVANTRVVGAEIAFFVNTMIEKIGLDPRKVHIMGHSLGGQIVGYAGERIKNLGKITSFDPAQPFYQFMPPSVRIDPTDAEFVEVIHTDSKSILLLGLGMSQLAGHVDFFPNNGIEQPGCKVDRIFKVLTHGILEGARSLAACDHQRAVDYFMETINSKCLVVGYTCKDWKSFLAGKCYSCGVKGESCAVLGAPTDGLVNRNNTKYYVKTHHSEPYCLFHYNVQVKLRNNKAKNQRGYFKLTLQGSLKTQTFELGPGARDLNEGASNSFLITTPDDLGHIESGQLKWISSRFSLLTTHKIYPEFVLITPMSIVEPKARTAATRQLCYFKSTAVSTGNTISLTNC